MSELFTGVIVIALVGNAAEHYSAISAARRNEMTLAVEIAIGSSAQIALLVAPILVLASFAMGTPMTLLFHPFEIAAIGLSVHRHDHRRARRREQLGGGASAAGDLPRLRRGVLPHPAAAH